MNGGPHEGRATIIMTVNDDDGGNGDVTHACKRKRHDAAQLFSIPTPCNPFIPRAILQNPASMLGSSSGFPAQQQAETQPSACQQCQPVPSSWAPYPWASAWETAPRVWPESP